MSGQTAIWLDGISASALPLPDRGLDFGDGLFETLLLKSGVALFSDVHLKRLHRGLQVLAFPPCLQTVSEQLQCAATAVAELGWGWTSLRMTVSRGAGPRGYAPPLCVKPRIIMIATELGRDCARMLEPAGLTLADIRWPTQPALAGLKHLNRLEQVLAAGQSRAAGADEAVMLNQSGQVVSVAAGNLFLVKGRRLSTPILDSCGIAGTRRSLIMQRWAPAIGVDAEEAVLTLQDIEAADEVFYSNSLVGLRPVARFGASRWTAHNICEALFHQYQGEIV